MNNFRDTTTPYRDAGYITKLPVLVQRLNKILQKFSDKDWNYSRIRITLVNVTAVQAPYLLGCELIDTASTKGARDVRDVLSEITWGDHHSNELGILELVSLRLNKAFLAVTGDDFRPEDDSSRSLQPVVRLVKRSDLIAAGATHALWYEIEEVSGEEFDSR